jgi:hypothetical protein
MWKVVKIHKKWEWEGEGLKEKKGKGRFNDAKEGLAMADTSSN